MCLDLCPGSIPALLVPLQENVSNDFPHEMFVQCVLKLSQFSSNDMPNLHFATEYAVCIFFYFRTSGRRMTKSKEWDQLNVATMCGPVTPLGSTTANVISLPADYLLSPRCSVFTMRRSVRYLTHVSSYWRYHWVARALPPLRQSLHGMASLDLPYRCPRCGEHKRFRSLSSLRAHLEYNHTYETLYVLSKSNSVCDAAALLPLVAEGALLTPANNNDSFEPLRPSALKERSFPCRELPCSDDLSLTPANSNTAARFIPNVEFPLGEIFMKKAMTSADPSPHGNPNTAVAVAANVAASAVEAAYEEGLARLKARAFERLELDERLEKLSEEVSMYDHLN